MLLAVTALALFGEAAGLTLTSLNSSYHLCNWGMVWAVFCLMGAVALPFVPVGLERCGQDGSSQRAVLNLALSQKSHCLKVASC